MNQKTIHSIIEILEKTYPDAICSLSWDHDPWKLLIMGMLSAQCTDERVNIVCKDLFLQYPTCEKLAYADITDVENYIRSCGLFHTKSKNIIATSKMIFENYNGQIPNDLQELIKLPGVGRKVANLVLGDAFHTGGIVTDTHCIRICGRLGFYSSNEKNPYKVEMILTPLIPKEKQSDYCHRMVLFGREYCNARNPKCNSCPLNQECKFNLKK